MVNTKTLWLGDSSTTPTGYGRIAKETLPLWVKSGHAVGHLGKQCGTGPLQHEGYTILPNWAGEMWNSVQRYITPDLDCISGVMDLHWMNPGVNFLMHLREQKSRTKLMLYFPIDGFPMAGSHMENIKLVDYPIVFSQYAARAMDTLGYKRDETYWYVPHGVNTEVFHPLPPEVRAKVREDNKLSDKFVVGSTNRNNYRKMLPRLMEAFSIFAKDKPDVVFIAHCDPNDAQGYNMGAWVARYGIADKVRFTAPNQPMIGLTDEQLNALYNALDVFATASTGEGFGLPIIEAQSAGVPIIAGDHTAQTELVKGHGWLVPTKDKLPTHEGLDYYTVDADGLAEALEEAYSDFGKRKTFARKSREFAEGYDWKRNIAPMWKTTIDAVCEKEGWEKSK